MPLQVGDAVQLTGAAVLAICRASPEFIEKLQKLFTPVGRVIAIDAKSVAVTIPAVSPAALNLCFVTGPDDVVQRLPEDQQNIPLEGEMLDDEDDEQDLDDMDFSGLSSGEEIACWTFRQLLDFRRGIYASVAMSPSANAEDWQGSGEAPQPPWSATDQQLYEVATAKIISIIQR